MSKEMKMSDYFKSTNKAMAIRAIYFSCREDNQPQSTEVSERKQKTLEAAAFAVEAHDRLVEENQRLTAIATKHAVRADELYEALESVIELQSKYYGNGMKLHLAMTVKVKELKKLLGAGNENV